LHKYALFIRQLWRPNFTTIAGGLRLLQIAALRLDLAENVFELAPKEQYLFLGNTFAVGRKRKVGVCMLARKVRVRPQIAWVPRERCHNPFRIRGDAGINNAFML